MLPSIDERDELYTLRGNSQFDLNESFRELRNSDQFCDVSLSCRNVNGGTFSVRSHRVILSAYSSIFKDMFSQHSNTTDPLVYLKGVVYEDLENLLDFMYNGEVSVRQFNLTSFLSAAEELQIKGLDNDSYDTAVFKTSSAIDQDRRSSNNDMDHDDLANESVPEKDTKANVTNAYVKVKPEPADISDSIPHQSKEDDIPDKEDTDSENKMLSTLKRTKSESSESNEIKKAKRSKPKSYDVHERDQGIFMPQLGTCADNQESFLCKMNNIGDEEPENFNCMDEKKSKLFNHTSTETPEKVADSREIGQTISASTDLKIKENDLVVATVRLQKIDSIQNFEFKNINTTEHLKAKSGKLLDKGKCNSSEDCADIKTNDLVIATVKGRKPWPAKVIEVLENGSCKVTFYETLNVNYTDKKVFSTKISKYNDETKKVLEKDQSEKMRQAIKKIDEDLVLQNA